MALRKCRKDLDWQDIVFHKSLGGRELQKIIIFWLLQVFIKGLKVKTLHKWNMDLWGIGDSSWPQGHLIIYINHFKVFILKVHESFEYWTNSDQQKVQDDYQKSCLNEILPIFATPRLSIPILYFVSTMKKRGYSENVDSISVL